MLPGSIHEFDCSSHKTVLCEPRKKDDERIFLCRYMTYALRCSHPNQLQGFLPLQVLLVDEEEQHRKDL